MKVGRDLTIEDLDNLKDGDKIYVEDTYMPNEKDLYVFIKYKQQFINYKDNKDIYDLKEIINDLTYEEIKIYKAMETNYERIKNMTIEEMAMSRIYSNQDKNGYFEWYGDFEESPTDSYSDAVKMELAWLNSEVKE